MPIVTFLPVGSRADVPAGTPLPAAARAAGVDIELPCAGDGSCGRCTVRVAGAVDSDSAGHLPEEALAEGYLLACRTRVLDDPVSVEVADPAAARRGQFAEDGGVTLVEESLLPAARDVEPLTVKWAVRVAAARLEDGLSDVDRLSGAVAAEHDAGEARYTLEALRGTADSLRREHGLVTVTATRARGELEVIRVEPGDETGRHYGAAVDLGTTSVAVQVVDLGNGRVLAAASDYNRQLACGADVISRINHARRPGGLAELRRRALETVNHLLCEAAFAAGVSPVEIASVAVSGNTVMTHLLLGLKPEYIRLEPYTPTVLQPPPLAARDVGLGINPDAPVLLSPCVGSYVGGDITAGLLCTDLAADTEDISLFIDIGTNGEIVVGSSDFLMACACSAGPAFEGGGIRCGVRAAAGAIERVAVDPDSGAPTCSTVGDGPPVGICGSGMIDLLANLLRNGWIDRMGELDRARPSRHVLVDGKRASYLLVAAGDSAKGADIVVSETEIANIIRAKAAIYSASALMLSQMGLGFEDLDRLYIAGSFGRFLDPEQAILIGMLPDLPRERYSWVGNASLTGSCMALVSATHRRRRLEMARRITYRELSTDLAYMDQYTAALFLPHTDLERFPNVAAELAAARERRSR